MSNVCCSGLRWGDSDDESSYASSEAADDSGALLALPAPRDVPGDAPLPQAAEGETQAGGSGALPAADAKTTDIPGAIATGSVGMCHFFQKNGWCGYGKACRWRHSDPNKPKRSRPKPSICRPANAEEGIGLLALCDGEEPLSKSCWRWTAGICCCKK